MAYFRRHLPRTKRRAARRNAPPRNSISRVRPAPFPGKTAKASGTRRPRAATIGLRPQSRTKSFPVDGRRSRLAYARMPAPIPTDLSDYVETALSGYELLNDPLLNKGTAFTEDERDAFDVHGLLPPHVAELGFQAKRRHAAFHGLGSDLQRYVFLRGLQDTNETLFYALLARNIEDMMPVVYTPTVGVGCQLFSHL